MGPFSEDKQWQRSQAIQRMIDDKSLSEEVRGMWSRKLVGLALTEDEYNQRVIEIYNSPSFRKMRIDFLGGRDV